MLHNHIYASVPLSYSYTILTDNAPHQIWPVLQPTGDDDVLTGMYCLHLLHQLHPVAPPL